MTKDKVFLFQDRSYGKQFVIACRSKKLAVNELRFFINANGYDFYWGKGAITCSYDWYSKKMKDITKEEKPEVKIALLNYCKALRIN